MILCSESRSSYNEENEILSDLSDSETKAPHRDNLDTGRRAPSPRTCSLTVLNKMCSTKISSTELGTNLF